MMQGEKQYTGGGGKTYTKRKQKMTKEIHKYNISCTMLKVERKMRFLNNNNIKKYDFYYPIRLQQHDDTKTEGSALQTKF